MNKDQYETVFLPNEESKTYIKERDKIYPIADMAYCANCEDLVDFSVQDENRFDIHFKLEDANVAEMRSQQILDIMIGRQMQNGKHIQKYEKRKSKILYM